MDYVSLAQQICELCIVPLLLVLSKFAISWLEAKTKEVKEKTKQTQEVTKAEIINKYVDMLDKTITECVIATTQTYVDALKKQNAFTKEAQAEAFNKSFDAVCATLTAEARCYLAEIYSDLDVYIKTKIEAEVKLNK